MNSIQHIFDLLSSAKQESLELSLSDCHVKGLFSLVIAGNEFGHLTRIFIAEQEIKPFDVQLHTHRYSIKLSPIFGQLIHHRANRDKKGEILMTEYEYSSAITGQQSLTSLGKRRISCSQYPIPPGSVIELSHQDFHTISCSQGATWMVEELGYQTEKSRVLGIPFEVKDMYRKPDISKILVMRDRVLETLQSFYGTGWKTVLQKITDHPR